MFMNKSANSPRVIQFNRAAASTRAAESIERDGLASDIFHNPQIHPPTWHFIISRQHNGEILYWGQVRSLAKARAASRAMLASLSAGARHG